MVNRLQPNIEQRDRERTFLAPVMSQTRGLFGSICSSILSSLQDSSSQELCQSLHQNLKLLVEIITSLESCIQQVMPSRGDTVAMETIESLPCNVLAIIRRSFSHCKESHTMYGDHFSAISEQLSVLFKRAYSLQKALMALLEVVSDPNCNHAVNLSKVCSGFHELCGIISGMDTTLLISTWRFLVKLISKHKDTIQNSFQASPLVESLCSEVEAHYRHALQQAPHPPPEEGGGSQGGDEKAFARTLKVCSLCFKMLHHLVKEFAGECLEECGPRVAGVVLTLQSLAPPSLEAPPITISTAEDLQRSVLVGIEPLIQLFVPSTRFCEAMLAVNQDHPSGQSLARLLTLLMVLKLLPSATDDACIQWLDPVVFPEDEPRMDLISGILSAVKQCYVEMNLPVSLPGVMSGGKAQTDVGLHEYVVTQLCGYVAAVPARYFHIVEKSLLKNVVSRDWDVAMVTVDVWCFMARYGSANLCAQHTKLLFDLLTSVPSNQSPAYLNICLLVRRLIPLMANEHQMELVTLYPVEKYPDIWADLELTSLPDSSRELVCEKLINQCIQAVRDWQETSEKRDESSAKQLIKSIICVQRLLTHAPSSQPITDSLIQPLSSALSDLCAVLSLDKLLPEVFGAILEVFSHLLHHVKPALISELLQTAISALKEDSPLTLRLACIHFLRRLAKKTLPPCPEQSSILTQIPVLFGKVLSDTNSIIHQQALEAFSSFAEETSHESVVPECISAENVQSRVVDFLNQIPAHSELVSRRSLEVTILQSQRNSLNAARDRRDERKIIEPQARANHDHKRDDTACKDGTKDHLEEPLSKRHRSDSEDSYRESVRTLKDALARLKDLKATSQECPDWLAEELTDAKLTVEALIGSS